jgi:hypothetical protein
MESMKYDKVIAGPLLVNCYLPTSWWGQVDLHTPDLRLTAYPLYAFSTWESMKISYLRKIRLRCIRTNLTNAAQIDGHTQETEDQCEISISIDC